MKKILAIGGSNSRQSIHKALTTYIFDKIENPVVAVVNWENLALPLYSVSLEAEIGIPESVLKLKGMIENADIIVLSLGKYNGVHTTSFKNFWNWISRVDTDFWDKKPMFFASTCI